MADQSWCPELKDQRYDNVLPAQGYCAPQGAMINEYEVMMEPSVGAKQRN